MLDRLNPFSTPASSNPLLPATLLGPAGGDASASGPSSLFSPLSPLWTQSQIGSNGGELFPNPTVIIGSDETIAEEDEESEEANTEAPATSTDAPAEIPDDWKSMPIELQVLLIAPTKYQPSKDYKKPNWTATAFTTTFGIIVNRIRASLVSEGVLPRNLNPKWPTQKKSQTEDLKSLLDILKADPSKKAKFQEIVDRCFKQAAKTSSEPPETTNAAIDVQAPSGEVMTLNIQARVLHLFKEPIPYSILEAIYSGTLFYFK